VKNLLVSLRKNPVQNHLIERSITRQQETIPPRRVIFTLQYRFVGTAKFANSIDLTTVGRHNLKIPSGGTSGLKIKGDFTVSNTRPTTLILDVDLRQSIKMAGPNYIMTPVLRLVSADNFGHVRGEIDPALLTAGNQNTDPVTTGKIAYDTAAAKYIYEAAFLPAGKYTIAFTCNSDKDDLEVDNDLKFFGIQNVTVKLNNTTFL
jgi:hypothetical protein